MTTTIKLSDAEIIKIAKGFTKGILNGRSTVDMCFIVCSSLAAYLSGAGVECTLTEGCINHCENELHHYWITLKDGRIIDPTADQFGLLNVWVRKQPSNYKMYTKEEREDYETNYQPMTPKQETDNWLSSLDSVIEGKEGNDKESEEIRKSQSGWN